MRNTSKNFQKGFSLFEALMALIIFGIVMSVVVSGYLGYRKFYLHTSSFSRLEQINTSLTGLLQNDIATSGAVSRGLVVKDMVDGTSQPAVFLSNNNHRLTLIATASEPFGEVVAQDPAKLVVTGVAEDAYLQLHRESLALYVSPAGIALLSVTGRPYRATGGDIPETVGFMNLKRTLVIPVTPVRERYGIGTLTAPGPAILPHAQLLVIHSIVKYDFVPTGEETGTIRRTEITPGQTPDATITNATPMMWVGNFEMNYVTTRGPRPALPADWTELRGIHIHFLMTDPTTKLTREEAFDEFVQSWDHND